MQREDILEIYPFQLWDNREKSKSNFAKWEGKYFINLESDQGHLHEYQCNFLEEPRRLRQEIARHLQNSLMTDSWAEELTEKSRSIANPDWSGVLRKWRYPRTKPLPVGGNRADIDVIDGCWAVLRFDPAGIPSECHLYINSDSNPIIIKIWKSKTTKTENSFEQNLRLFPDVYGQDNRPRKKNHDEKDNAFPGYFGYYDPNGLILTNQELIKIMKERTMLSCAESKLPSNSLAAFFCEKVEDKVSEILQPIYQRDKERDSQYKRIQSLVYLMIEYFGQTSDMSRFLKIMDSIQ